MVSGTTGKTALLSVLLLYCTTFAALILDIFAPLPSSVVASTNPVTRPPVSMTLDVVFEPMGPPPTISSRVDATSIHAGAPDPESNFKYLSFAPDAVIGANVVGPDA